MSHWLWNGKGDPAEQERLLAESLRRMRYHCPPPPLEPSHGVPLWFWVLGGVLVFGVGGVVGGVGVYLSEQEPEEPEAVVEAPEPEPESEVPVVPDEGWSFDVELEPLVRSSHTPARFTRPPVLSEETVALRVAIREGDCEQAHTLLRSAMEQSEDNGILYSDLWSCTLNQTIPIMAYRGRHGVGHSAAPVHTQRLVHPDELATLDTAFERGPEHRLRAMEEDPRFEETTLDLLGPEHVAAVLARDLVLEAEAAWALARLPEELRTQETEARRAERTAWATRGLLGPAGDLARDYTPELRVRAERALRSSLLEVEILPEEVRRLGFVPLEGLVVDSGGEPLGGVLVTAMEARGSTDAHGRVDLDLTPTDHTLKASAPGHATGLARALSGQPHVELHLAMADALVPFPPEEGLDVTTRDGARVRIPPHAVDARGEVLATITLLQTPEELRGHSLPASTPTDILSCGRLEVELRTPDGAPVHLVQPAEVSFPDPGATSPPGLYHLDETDGAWTKEGSWRQEDGRLVASVEQLGWLGAEEVPEGRYQVRLRLEDADANLMDTALLLSIDGESHRVLTDKRGRACLWVPKATPVETWATTQDEALCGMSRVKAQGPTPHAPSCPCCEATWDQPIKLTKAACWRYQNR